MSAAPMDPQPTPEAGWQLVDFNNLLPTPCPCGQSRRAFINCEQAPASLHQVEISQTARTHYHKGLTEYYYILACQPDAALELNGERVAVQVGQCILIPPGTRHRALGQMTVLNLVVPKFDPADEWFD